MSKVEELETQIKKWKAVLLQAFIVGEAESIKNAKNEITALKNEITALKEEIAELEKESEVINITVTNAGNDYYNKFMSKVFERIDNVLRRDPENKDKKILMTRLSKGVWVADSVGYEITFEDIDRRDIQYVSIRKLVK